MHPETYCVFNGRWQDVKVGTVHTVTVPFKSASPGTVPLGNVHVEVGPLAVHEVLAGDGSVLVESAKPDCVRPAFRESWGFTDVEHGPMANHPKVREYLIRKLVEIL
jgi:hypothetical protein